MLKYQSQNSSLSKCESPVLVVAITCIIMSKNQTSFVKQSTESCSEWP